jgi:hypothetical protein
MKKMRVQRMTFISSQVTKLKMMNRRVDLKRSISSESRSNSKDNVSDQDSSKVRVMIQGFNPGQFDNNSNSQNDSKSVKYEKKEEKKFDKNQSQQILLNHSNRFLR